MDAIEYQIWRNKMCEEYSQHITCEGCCPLEPICTLPEGSGNEENAVMVVESYKAQKMAVWGKYAVELGMKCGGMCSECPIWDYTRCKVLREAKEEQP